MSTRRVTLYDVGPRDGLQNEPEILDVETRAELVRRLVATGLPGIEVASFVNPKRVPQMADAEAVCAGLPVVEGVTTIGMPLGLGVIVFTIVITGIYVRRANSEYDELTEQITRGVLK